MMIRWFHSLKFLRVTPTQKLGLKSLLPAGTIWGTCSRFFQKQTFCLLLTLILGFSFVPAATAANPSVTEVKVSLGSSAGELRFFPNTFEFVAGQTYKLLLHNPSPQKHYFTAKDFADASWTRKVDAGNVEIKGAIRELELRPGSTAEWMFVPMKPGTYGLRCPIAGHTEAGMTGEITVVAP